MRNRGGDAAGRGGRLAIGAHAEKLDDVADLGVAAIRQQALDTFDRHILDSRRGAAGLAHDVVAVLSVQGELVKAGAIVQVAAAHQADLFKRRETAINGDEVADLGPDFLVNALDADRPLMAVEGSDDGEARLGDAQPGAPDATAGPGQCGLLCLGIGGRGQGVVRLGRGYHAG